MSDRAREIAEGIVALWVNEHKDAGSKLVHHGLPLGVWLPRECSDLVARIAEGIDAEVAERVGVLQSVYDAALAWESARQAIYQPGQFVETHPAEMSERMHAHHQREKELRALCRAALATAGAPGSQVRSAEPIDPWDLNDNEGHW